MPAVARSVVPAPPRPADPPVRAAELRETRDLLERALDEHADLYQFSPVGYVRFDDQGLVADLNDRAAGLLGERPRNLIGLPLVHCFAEPDHRGFHEHLRRCNRAAAETGGTVRNELRLAPRRGGDDRGVPVQLLSRPLRGGRGGFQTAVVDLTEIREAEAGLRRAQAELLRRTEEAEARSAALARLHARVTRAERDERDRLARHLHDHLQQHLVAATMQAHIAGVMLGDGADRGALRELLGKLSRSVDDALTSSRTLTAELSPPPVLHELGLPAGLHWLAEFYGDRHGLRVSVDRDRFAGDKLPQRLRTLLFEVARELLLNVVKYAGVTSAAIRLDRMPDRLRLSVADAGRRLFAGRGAGARLPLQRPGPVRPDRAAGGRGRHGPHRRRPAPRHDRHRDRAAGWVDSLAATGGSAPFGRG